LFERATQAFARFTHDTIEFVGVDAERPVVIHASQCAPGLLPMSIPAASPAAKAFLVGARRSSDRRVPDPHPGDPTGTSLDAPLSEEAA
jgi:hypothetical protein